MPKPEPVLPVLTIPLVQKRIDGLILLQERVKADAQKQLDGLENQIHALKQLIEPEPEIAPDGQTSDDTEEKRAPLEDGRI